MTETKAPRTYKECRRCAGSGDWAPGRACFACAGRGRVVVWTRALKVEAKREHIAECVREIADLEGRKARRPATGFDRWRDTDEARLTAWREQLVRLEAELAALVD